MTRRHGIRHRVVGILLLLVGSVIAIAAGALGFASRTLAHDRGRICSGVTVGGIDVGDLTPEEATSKLQKRVLEQGERVIEFAVGSDRYRARWQDLGIDYDLEGSVSQAAAVGYESNVLWRTKARLSLLAAGVQIPLGCSLDKDRARKWLSAIAAKADLPPKDAEAEWTGERVLIKQEQAGRKLEVEAAVRSLTSAAMSASPSGKADLVFRQRSPRVTQKDLKSLDALLSRFGTSFDPGKKNRTHNIRLAVAALDRQLLRPREVFSYNHAVGPRLEEKGYLPAPIFSDDEVVQGVGGGVCQVATTLYNTALLAGLQIISRAHHSRPVTYAPRGRDATVYFGNTDLRFRNNTSMPIYLRAHVRGHRVEMELIGDKSQKKEVKLESVRGASITAPVERIEDPNLPAGTEQVEEEGHRGYRATVVRIIKVSPSRTIRETISRDYYHPKGRVVRVGTGKKAGEDNDTFKSEAGEGSPPPPAGTEKPTPSPQPRTRVEDIGGGR